MGSYESEGLGRLGVVFMWKELRSAYPTSRVVPEVRDS